MACIEFDAQYIFWMTPELLNKLLPMLNTQAVWSLATAQPLIVKVLQNTLTWNQLIRGSSHWSMSTVHPASKEFSEITLELNRTEMSYLAGILKKMKDPKPYLIDLLNLICQRFPPYDYFHVRVNCPRHTSHPVSVLGILLLEDTEGALGSAIQEIKAICLHKIEDPWLTAIGSRGLVSRGR